MDRMVRGFWGPRRQPLEELAVLWKSTLDAVATLLPAAWSEADGVRWLLIRDDGKDVEFAADEAALLAVLREEEAGEGWTERTGVGPRLVASAATGWRVSVTGRTGGASPSLLQAMLIKVGAPDGAIVPEAELLGAVAELWHPDFGDVVDNDELDALEEAGALVAEPGVGRVGFLSPARAALVPDDLKAERTPLPSLGVLLDIAPPGAADTVAAAYLRLREAGALEPLPHPMDRSLL
ncbi:hypothetical protein [Streptomyces sp. NPDC051561]|uniref:hypothetical protein n=1 Tax=Streptomyces sp. NPDC051561 TaxID=3365658 RepID=UPI0037A0B114